MVYIEVIMETIKYKGFEIVKSDEGYKGYRYWFSVPQGFDDLEIYFSLKEIKDKINKHLGDK